MKLNLSELPTAYIQIALSLVLIILYFAGSLIIKRFIQLRIRKSNFDHSRQKYMTKFFNFILAGLIITLISIVWDVSFRGLSIYFASIFAVIGVAFFAQWSVLSNITAAIILFFNHSFKIGNKIKILDGDNSVTGTIVDIQSFHFIIKTESGENVIYPNNLIIQRPVIQLDIK